MHSKPTWNGLKGGFYSMALKNRKLAAPIKGWDRFVGRVYDYEGITQAMATMSL